MSDRPEPKPGFFSSVFDFSFQRSSAIQIIKIAFIVYVILCTIFALVCGYTLIIMPLGFLFTPSIYGGAYESSQYLETERFVWAILAILIVIVFYFMTVAIGRFFCEFMLAYFKIEGHLRGIEEKLRKQNDQPQNTPQNPQ